MLPEITAVTMDTLLVGLDRAVYSKHHKDASGTRVWLDVTSHEQQPEPVAVRYNTRRVPRQWTQVPVCFPATGGSCQVVSTWHLAEAAPVRTTADECTVADRCHATSRFRFPFTVAERCHATSRFRFPFSTFRLPFSNFQPRKRTAFTGWVYSRPIMRGIYRPADGIYRLGI